MPKKRNTRKPQSRTAAKQAELNFEKQRTRRLRVTRVIGALFAFLIVIATVIAVIAGNLNFQQ